MPNFRIYILDAYREPVPAGVRGELYIGGVGVARGYLHQPQLTAERFIPDPFGPADAKMYRTGDLARHTANGVIEYLGRIDAQVKIRGFRVEPGEIEAVLERQPGVRDAVVIVREDRPGDQRLVAYVVGEADPAVLRAAAERALPDYMVPSAFIALDRIPLSANGKVDRRMLPAPAAAVAPLEADGAMVSDTERRLLAIWADVLGAPAITVTDDFFELGASSLLMVLGAMRIQQELGVKIEQEELFELPTVRDLAGRVDALRTGA